MPYGMRYVPGLYAVSEKGGYMHVLSISTIKGHDGNNDAMGVLWVKQIPMSIRMKGLNEVVCEGPVKGL